MINESKDILAGCTLIRPTWFTSRQLATLHLQSPNGTTAAGRLRYDVDCHSRLLSHLVGLADADSEVLDQQQTMVKISPSDFPSTPSLPPSARPLLLLCLVIAVCCYTIRKLKLQRGRVMMGRQTAPRQRTAHRSSDLTRETSRIRRFRSI